MAFNAGIVLTLRFPSFRDRHLQGWLPDMVDHYNRTRMRRQKPLEIECFCFAPRNYQTGQMPFAIRCGCDLLGVVRNGELFSIAEANDRESGWMTA